MADATPTLYDWAGGREPIGRMLNAFYDRVEADELLAPVFDGAVSAAHREAVTAWWSEVFGGPADYTARHGGYENMLARHRGLGDHPRAAAPLRRAAERRRRRRGPARRPRVPLGAAGLRRVGNAAGDAQLGPRGRGRPPRAGAALGLGRGAALRALTGPAYPALVNVPIASARVSPSSSWVTSA